METADPRQLSSFMKMVSLNPLRATTRAWTWGSMARFEAIEGSTSSYVVDPLTTTYRLWWYFTTACAVMTALFTPWEVAFERFPGLRPYTDFEAIVEYFFTSVFVIDILINFNKAYQGRNGLMEYSRKDIAWNYFRFMFWIDLVGVLPLGMIAVEAFDDLNERRIRFLALFRLLRMVRLHRIFKLFRELETNISLSRLAVTLIRNLSIVILSTHVAGCLFFFVSKQHGLFDFCELEGEDLVNCQAAGDTWLGGASAVDLLELTKTEQYIYSLYWSITTMTTVGYGDLSPRNTAEVVFAMVYMLFNIALNSYILGTITLLVVKADENTGALRECYRNVTTFANLNDLPIGLKKSLKHHMQFNMAHPEIQDDAVLQGLPAGLRRMVLKELYVKKLQATSTFQECSLEFLAALTKNGHVDTYLPHQQIVDEGDVVPELHVMIAGEAVKRQTSVYREWEGVKKDVGRLSSGDLFCPEAFFKNTAMPWAVYTTTICRVLVISKASFDEAAAQFPEDASVAKRTAAYHSKFCSTMRSPFTKKRMEDQPPAVSPHPAVVRMNPAPHPIGPVQQTPLYPGINQKVLAIHSLDRGSRTSSPSSSADGNSVMSTRGTDGKEESGQEARAERHMFSSHPRRG